jgi:hypothetical protein
VTRLPPGVRGAQPARGGFRGGGFEGPATAPATRGDAQTEPPPRPSSSSALARPLPPSRPLPAVIGKPLRFEVLIAELNEQGDALTAGEVLALEKAGKLSFAHRMQLMTVESEPAFVQLGALTPRVIGRSTTGLTVVPIYNDINVGTMSQITGRVEDDGSIVAQVYVERSALTGGPEEAFDPGANAPHKGVDRVLTSSTLRLRPGEPQVIGSSQATQGQETSKTWIVVTGHVGAGN